MLEIMEIRQCERMGRVSEKSDSDKIVITLN
jgi:hypothetical protein